MGAGAFVKLVGAIAVDAKVVKMPNQGLAVGDIGSKPRIFQCNGPFKLLCTRAESVHSLQVRGCGASMATADIQAAK